MEKRANKRENVIIIIYISKKKKINKNYVIREHKNQSIRKQTKIQ